MSIRKRPSRIGDDGRLSGGLRAKRRLRVRRTPSLKNFDFLRRPERTGCGRTRRRRNARTKQRRAGVPRDGRDNRHAGRGPHEEGTARCPRSFPTRYPPLSAREGALLFADVVAGAHEAKSRPPGKTRSCLKEHRFDRPASGPCEKGSRKSRAPQRRNGQRGCSLFVRFPEGGGRGGDTKRGGKSNALPAFQGVRSGGK